MFLSILPDATVALATGSGIVDQMVNGICSLIGPFVGGNSKMLSLVFLLSLGAVVLLWFLNENKEGIIVWLIRTGLCLGVLINIFTLPQLFGLPGICGG